jgi:excinuclease ABC subunit A
VTSLSTYARQFLERLPRPAVDSISHLPPAIAIERRNRAASDRATVGTASEVIDSLRVLFARCGQMRCPECETRVVTGGAVSVAERLEARFDSQRIQLAAPFGRHGVAGDAVAYRDRMAAAGHTRVLDLENRVVDWSAASPSEVESLLAGGLLLVDRLVPDRGAGRRRLLEAVEVAFDLGAGEVVVVDAAGHRESLRDAFGCPGCGTSSNASFPTQAAASKAERWHLLRARRAASPATRCCATPARAASPGTGRSPNCRARSASGSSRAMASIGKGCAGSSPTLRRRPSVARHAR